MAYANPDPSLTGRGCLLWFSDILDIRVLPEGSGSGGDIFVRMASYELDSQSISKKNQGEAANIKIIILVIFPVVLLIGFISTWLCYVRRKRNYAEPTEEGFHIANGKSPGGYMSPEYALDGLFSIKSDVFSFGVLTLEFVSGKRNRGFIDPENENNLIGHVWNLYNEGRSMELIDASCTESCHPPEVIRSINVGLLCVQQNAADRSNMSSVILMLDIEGELLQPKKPSFFMETEFPVTNFSSSTYTGASINDITITELHLR
ncbi:hypothetical protein L1987_19593 [Smallanthus sonchifolius]|uniref:Uncharacterized protein n=1 Tax=Smallanthus sonchifolius TaxID=185202 RepID=A0ACB9IR44_9ASTR|nr:hypothetical protein L1987_19593 [Smallanthus sonchifolius]